MSLLLKSEQNYEATEVLLFAKLYAPAVHCAYYSSLQHIIYLVHEYTGLTEDEIRENTKGGGSHNYYISTFAKELMRIDRRNALLFSKFINNFKRKRTEADYNKEEVSKEDSNDAQKFATKLKKFLNLVYDEGECRDIYTL